jgi:ribonuclease E
MPNKMLIDASHPEETRVVVVRGNRVEEFDFESANRRQLRGNIYLAKVTRVEPSLQACFVDYGGNRHGFLAFSEIHPDYYQIPVADRQALIEEEERAAREAEERRTARHQARHARRDEAISEPAQENGEAAHDAAHEAVHGEDGSHDEHGSIEEVPHDDEAPEEVGAQNENGEHAHESEPAAFNEAAGSDSGGAAEASEVPSEPSLIEMGEEQAREARQDHVEDESVEQVGGGAMEEVPERQHRRHRRYKIQEVIKRRQVLLVQVVKEERGTKGAALTTYLSLAGRYSVLMPNTSRGGGISRKITSSQDRQRLKELVEDLEVPEGMGVILRTAGASRTKPEIKRDFEYLLRLWETVRELTLKSQAPSLV